MAALTRLLLLTFCESLGTVLFERGVYFYTEARLAFSPVMNLTLAVVFGVLYVAGALVSHPVSERTGEKRLLVWALVVQIAMVLLVLASPTGPMMFVAAVVLGGCNGLKWPVIESYIAAGRTGRSQATAVGRFNVAWSSSVPVAMVVTGPLVAWDPGDFLPWVEPGVIPGVSIFAAAGVCSVIGLWLVRRLAASPLHLTDDDPTRLPAPLLENYRRQLWSSRWLMLSSYSLLFIMAPLMPFIFRNLGYEPKIASSLSGVVDLVRLATFITLDRWVGWHGRVWPLLAVIAFMPVGFFMVVLGQDTATVLGGQMIFGVMAGVSYYAALYYAMAVKNASVEAGGLHEGLIGGGFFLGPLLGLAAQHVGFGLGVGPLIVVCAVLAIYSLRPRPHRAPHKA